MEKYICVHCHFYQPPRENPWLEAVEIQDSAHPYHDWNERVALECYEANGTSRILKDGYVSEIVNNYSLISFNFGPTLLSWISEKKPEVYQRILEADRISVINNHGHGNAIAQAYNHIILPLANERDIDTQIKWGIADFKFRFKRDPEGMWLPETAVNTLTLEKLAENGIKFTILAPNQCAQIRALNDGQWQDISQSKINSNYPYKINLPNGKSIAAFIYNKEVSQAVAFEKLLEKGENFVNRLLAQFSQEKTPQLVNIATDGETYGHHFPFGDMGLAYALAEIAKNTEVRIINYGSFLEQFPPQYELAIYDNSSWSCAHGIERWKANCGCRMNPQILDQSWRTTLRESLDWLRDKISPFFEEEMKKYVDDPWHIRNEYVHLILNRKINKKRNFLKKYSNILLNKEQEIAILKLLEMQRNSLLMYTSCGWFFDDMSGIETVQIIQYAARVIQLFEQIFKQNLEEEFLNRLQLAKSNYPRLKNGKYIYLNFVKERILQLHDVAAHFAINNLFNTNAENKFFYCYEAKIHTEQRYELGKSKLLYGDATFRSNITHGEYRCDYLAVHYRDQNLSCAINDRPQERISLSKLNHIKDAFLSADYPAVNKAMREYYNRPNFTIKSLFRDEQRKIANHILEENLMEVKNSFFQLYNNRADLISFLNNLSIPLPQGLFILTTYMINEELSRLSQDFVSNLKSIIFYVKIATQLNIKLEESTSLSIQKFLECLMVDFVNKPQNYDLLYQLVKSLRILSLMNLFNINLWKLQNIYSFNYKKLLKNANGYNNSRWLNQFKKLGHYLKMKTD